MMIRNRFFWVRAGRSFLSPGVWEIALIVRPLPDQTGEGYLITGRHFEVRFTPPRLSLWAAKVGPTA